MGTAQLLAERPLRLSLLIGTLSDFETEPAFAVCSDVMSSFMFVVAVVFFLFFFFFFVFAFLFRASLVVVPHDLVFSCLQNSSCDLFPSSHYGFCTFFFFLSFFVSR